MKRIFKVIGLLAVPIALVATLGGTTNSPAFALTNTQMANDIINHTASQSEINTCMSISACKQLVIGSPDTTNNAGVEQDETSAFNQLGSTQLANDGCPSGKPWHAIFYWDKKNGLGQLVYRWHLGVWFCRNGNTNAITKWRDVKDWTTNAMWFVNVTSDHTTVKQPCCNPFSADVASAFRQRKIQLVMFSQFVPINVYPNGQIWVYGNNWPSKSLGSAG